MEQQYFTALPIKKQNLCFHSLDLSSLMTYFDQKNATSSGDYPIASIFASGNTLLPDREIG